MQVSENKFVSVTYTLTVEGNIVDKADNTRPLEFIFGTGALLPKFEENILNKSIGDKVSFTLAAEQGYGEIIPEAVVELPISIFMVDGEINREMLTEGNVLPMMDADGNRMMGQVKEIGLESVKMDFNHPMAGKTLNFDVEVVGVRDVTPDDLKGGCSCGCDSEGCDSGCDSGCNCN